MFGEIARFLLNTIFTLFGAALLLRAWMQVVRMPPYNPVSNAVMQATNWLVLPLRKILPAAKTIDWASIVAAFLAALVFVILMVLLAGVDPAGLAVLLPTLLVVAVITVIKWALNLIIWMTILMALLSWLNPQSPAMPLLYQLTAPFLEPLRRVLPRMGGIDLSPILLFVIVQVLLMVVTRLAVSLTMFGVCFRSEASVDPGAVAVDGVFRVKSRSLRASYNGNTLASQARAVGSIPIARSSFRFTKSRLRRRLFDLQQRQVCFSHVPSACVSSLCSTLESVLSDDPR